MRAAIVFCGLIAGSGVINRWIYTKAMMGRDRKVEWGGRN